MKQSISKMALAVFAVGCCTTCKFAIAQEQQAPQQYAICYGEFEELCKRHPYDTFIKGPETPFDPNGAIAANLCGTEPGGRPKGTWQPTIGSIPGNCCGYAWGLITCH
jgi:hypothetical protein